LREDFNEKPAPTWEDYWSILRRRRWWQPLSTIMKRFLILALLAVAFGCARDPKTEGRRYVNSAQHYLAIGEYEKASIQFRNALQADPRSAQAYYGLGQASLKLQFWPQAYDAFTRALQIDPGHAPARLQLAELDFRTHRWEEARREVSEVLSLDPNNVEARLLSGDVALGTKDYRQAIAELEEAARLAPGDPRPRAELATVNLTLQKYADAERGYNRAIELDPRWLPAYLNLAQLYQLEHRRDLQESILRSAIAHNPQSAEPCLALATVYQRERETGKVESLFAELRARTNSAAALLATVGDFYLKAGDAARAKEWLQQSVSRDGKNLEVHKRLVEAYIALQEWDEAEKANREILAAQPTDTVARVSQARLLMVRGKKAEAVAILLQLVSDAPDAAMAHFVLALAYGQGGEILREITSLKDSLARDADFIPAYVTLGEVYLQQQETKTALLYATEALKRNPGLLAARLLEANAHLALADFRTADRLLGELLRQDSKNPLLLERLGYSQGLQKRYPEAERCLEQALEVQPAFIPAMRDLVEVYLAQKEPERAVARLKKQIQLLPQESALHELLGYVHLAANDPESAERAYTQAVALRRDSHIAHVQLARIYAGGRRFSQAIGEVQEAIRVQPDFLPAYVMLGQFYESTGMIDQAKTSYQRALESNPNYSAALNNLAWLYCEHGGNLDEALGLAQRALHNSPNDPHVTDTLAWIDYRKGQYAAAAGMLQDAVRRSPDAALLRYHLGMVLLKGGKKEQARSALQQALLLKLSSMEAEEARRALRQLEQQPI